MTPNPAIIQSVEKLGYRVTTGDIATQLGLNIAEASQGLLALASDAGGHLQVAESGDIIYEFPRNFRDILRNKYFQLRLQEVWQKIWQIIFYLIRLSFGIFLIVSIVLISVTIFLIITYLSSDRDNNSGSSSNRSSGRGGFFFFPDLFWYFSPNYRERSLERRRNQGENSDLNFFEAVFSFLFGDGNPNANLEERRWQEIAGVIQNNQGAIAAEQVTPYLDELGEKYQQEYEDYMLPVLVRFNGEPKVSSEGEIVYYFPELQVKASQRNSQSVSEYLHEFTWRFSAANSGQIMLSAGLGILNFAGAIFLGILFRDHQVVTRMGEFIGFVHNIYWLLMAYGTGFLGIPLVRYFWIKLQNDKIATRNRDRVEKARLIADADTALQQKIAYARQFAGEKVIGKEDSVYSTGKDLLEQEFKGIEPG